MERHIAAINKNLKRLGFVDFVLQYESSALKRILLSNDVGDINLGNICLDSHLFDRLISVAQKIEGILSKPYNAMSDNESSIIVLFRSQMKTGLQPWIKSAIIETMRDVNYKYPVVHPEFQDDEIADALIEANPYNLFDVDSQFKTHGRILNSVKRMPRIITHINESRISEEVALAAIEQDPRLIEHISPSVLTQKIVIAAFVRDRSLLPHFPLCHVTKEMVIEAVLENPDAVLGIDSSMATIDVFRLAMRLKPVLAVHCPKEWVTESDLLNAIESDIQIFSHIPESMKSFRLSIKACQIDPEMLSYVPMSQLTRRFCVAILKERPDAEREMKIAIRKAASQKLSFDGIF